MSLGTDTGPDEVAEHLGFTRFTYDWDETAPAVAVVDAVSEALERDPRTLRPLGDVVDTHAVNSVFRAPVSGTVDCETLLTFSYHGFMVTLSDDGQVILRETEEPTSNRT